MVRRAFLLVLLMGLPLAGLPADLATASCEQLLQVYQQLRSLQGSPQGAVAENVVFKRDAATFTFLDGRLTFAAPVEGHVLGAVFVGRGTFELRPPTAIGQRQISRFSGGPMLRDTFRQAVFFFSDGSLEQLQPQVRMRSDADAAQASKAFADAEGMYQETYNDWWSNVRSHNPRMRNLAARLLSDLTDPSSRGLFLADFKAEHAGDLLFQISWNRPSILLPDVNSGDEVMLLHTYRNNYYEWWAGFHLAEEYAQSPHPDHRTLVAHCSRETVDLDLSKDNHISATAEMEFQVQEGAPRLLPFNLRGVLRISGIEDASGKKLSFIQEDRKLDNDPWLILPEPAVAGKTYKVKISYREDSTRDSRIISQQGSGLYFVGARESWFPSFGAFDDRTNFVLNIHSPKKYQMVASGELGKSEKTKDSVETEWKTDLPLGVIGFNYGQFVEKKKSDAQLTVTAYSGKEVPDELKAVDAQLEQMEIAAGPQGGQGGLAGRLGIMTGGFDTAANTQYAAGVSFQALKLDEFFFGKLPFKSVAVTEQPVRGFGQSWPYLIFLPYDSLLDSTTRQSLRLQNAPEAREFYNIVAVHEMAHQWWGHLVGWMTYHDQWLSEGMAEFSASLYLRQFEPKKLDSFWDLKRKWLLSKDAEGHRPVDVGPIWLGAQLPSYHEPELYRILVYDKGAYVLEMLRTLMRDPTSKNPDARFIATMHDFTSTYAGKNASTQDFQRMVEKHMGRSMDWFFNEWVYGTETPHYDFKYSLTDAGGGKTRLQMSVTQSGVSDSFRMEVPVDALVNGRTIRLGLMGVQGSRTATGSLVLPVRPNRVVLDAGRSILCTLRQ
jgi:Peptidase family M1 domain